MAINPTLKKSLRLTGSLVPILLIALFVLFPVFSVLINGVIDDEGFTLEYLKLAFTDGFNYKLFAFSISQALLSTLVTLLLGVPIALIFSKYEFLGRKILLVMFTVPFILPSVLVGMGFLNVFGENGFLGSPLLSIVLAHAFYNIPLVIHYFSSYYQNFDQDLIIAAKTMKSKSIHTFLRVYFPLFIQPIITSALLTFNFCFLSFGLILILGSPARFRTIEAQIYAQYLPGETNSALALAIMQMIVTIAYLILFMFFMRKNTRREKIITTATSPREKIDIRKMFSNWQNLFLALIFIAGFLLEILPMFSIIIYSFFETGTNNLTFSNYSSLFQPEISNLIEIPFYKTILNTLLFSFTSSIIASLLAIVTIAALENQKEKKFFIIYELIIFLPLAISSITLSLGVLSTFANIPLFTNYPWLYMIISYSLFGYPFVIRALLNGLNSIDPEIEEAAKTLGAKWYHKLWKIYLPLLLPSLLAGFVFAFGLSLGEFTISNIFYLKYDSVETLTVALYNLRNKRHFGESNASGVILLALSYLGFFLIEFMGRKEKHFPKLRPLTRTN